VFKCEHKDLKGEFGILNIKIEIREIILFSVCLITHQHLKENPMKELSCGSVTVTFENLKKCFIIFFIHFTLETLFNFLLHMMAHSIIVCREILHVRVTFTIFTRVCGLAQFFLVFYFIKNKKLD
jgi:hypothetical protein